MRLPKDLLSGNYKKPRIFLCEPNKEKICQMIYDWLLRYNAFSGEHVMQDDDCQIYAS